MNKVDTLIFALQRKPRRQTYAVRKAICTEGPKDAIPPPRRPSLSPCGLRRQRLPVHESVDLGELRFAVVVGV